MTDAGAAVQSLGVLYKTTFRGDKSIYELAVAINELFKKEADLTVAENQIKDAEMQAQKKEAAANQALTVGSSLTGPQPRQAAIYIADAKKIRDQAISRGDDAKKDLLERIKIVDRMAAGNLSSGNHAVAIALCASLYAVLDRALPESSFSSSVPRDLVSSEKQKTPEKAKLIPKAWMAETPASEKLVKAALILFPAFSSETEALRKAISKIPGIENKEPDVACRILEKFCRVRDNSLIENETHWSQYDKMLVAFKGSGISGDCPGFAAEQFTDAATRTQLSFAKIKQPINWSDPAVQKRLEFWFREIVWAIHRKEIRLSIAFGAAIYEHSWPDVVKINLTDGSTLGARMRDLREELENGHSFDIQLKIEGILENLPLSCPFSKAQIWRKAESSVTGEDIDRADIRGLLPVICTLHGRSFRFALASRIAGLLRGVDKLPSKLSEPGFVLTILDGCSSLEEAENPYTIATELMKQMPDLKADAAMEIARIAVRSISIAIKEGTSN